MKINLFRSILAVYFLALGIDPTYAQTGNQSDITGPNPLEIVIPSSTQQGIVSGGGIDRAAYESQLQQSDFNTAVQLLEEYQAQEFCVYLRLEHCGTVPSVAQISESLYNLWQTTGEKAAFIYVAATTEQLEIFTIFPQEVKGKSGESLPLILHHSNPQAPRGAVLETVREFRSRVTNVRRSRANILPSARQLYQWLIAPIVAELKANEIKTLVFAMDSGLRLIPLGALDDGQGFLIEKYAIGVVPSFGLADIGYVDIRNSPILAMGASVFSEQNDLPGVPVELNTIAQMPWPNRIFLNRDFTINNFIQQNQNQRFTTIHLATHGSFQAGNLEDSYIQFFDRRLNLAELRQLADQLGWSTSPLPLVELFILSACQTALGNEQSELGFAGLAVQAGVKTAFASLWLVSDIGTLALMSEFYQQLQQTPLKARALQQAQLNLLRGKVRVKDGILHLSNGKQIILPPELSNDNIDLSHPYFWGSFVNIGNWN